MSRFQTTRWNLIASAAHAEPAQAGPALEQLCRAYRPPVVAYIRHCGHSAIDAEDLAQGFFLHFLERAWYTRADPGRGRFRALMLSSLRHFLADQRAASMALKRGGGRHADGDGIELVAAPGETPEQAFDRSWLGIVLSRALDRLRAEWHAAGRQERFDHLLPLLAEPADGPELKTLAARLHARSNTLAVQLHRMRARLQQLVRLELLHTVGSREALEAELAALRDVIDAVP